VVLDHLPTLTGERDDVDVQARYLEVEYEGTHYATIYLPNGNPINTEKFPYKLGWMERLKKRAEILLASETPFVFAGDFNVCPLDKDCYSPKRFANDALLQPESRDLWHGLVNLGLTDAFRVFDQRAQQYSYWDYTGGSYDKDNGVRIDHFLLSPQLADRLVSCTIDREPRAKIKASDHTPVLCEVLDAEHTNNGNLYAGG
ncbi:MAG: exodeoxyribonuclease III, partial [Alphaproteobacteria bacterium]